MHFHQTLCLNYSSITNFFSIIKLGVDVFYLKPTVAPKRPFTGDRSIPDEHGTDYESKRKQRKIEKMREAEEARIREQKQWEERLKEMKIKQESEEEKTNEVIQQILEQEPAEV